DRRLRHGHTARPRLDGTAARLRGAHDPRRLPRARDARLPAVEDRGHPVDRPALDQAGRVDAVRGAASPIGRRNPSRRTNASPHAPSTAPVTPAALKEDIMKYALLGYDTEGALDALAADDKRALHSGHHALHDEHQAASGSVTVIAHYRF